MRSVERTFWMSFFSPELAAIIITKAISGKTVPSLKAGWLMVMSTDCAILGMMK